MIRKYMYNTDVFFIEVFTNLISPQYGLFPVHKHYLLSSVLILKLCKDFIRWWCNVIVVKYAEDVYIHESVGYNAVLKQENYW